MDNPFNGGKGLPLVYFTFTKAGGMLPSGAFVDYGPAKLDPLNLVIDLIFWYLVSCAIIYVYEVSTKKKRKKG